LEALKRRELCEDAVFAHHTPPRKPRFQIITAAIRQIGSNDQVLKVLEHRTGIRPKAEHPAGCQQDPRTFPAEDIGEEVHGIPIQQGVQLYGQRHPAGACCASKITHHAMGGLQA